MSMTPLLPEGLPVMSGGCELRIILVGELGDGGFFSFLLFFGWTYKP
jgi:hypothetical protein